MTAKNHFPLLVALLAVVVDCKAAAQNHSLDPHARAVVGGREVQISVAQDEMHAYISETHWSVTPSPLPTLDLESKGARDAEKAVWPLRDAMVGFDFDRKAQSAAEETLRSLDWFGATVIVFGKTADNETRSAQLDATPGQEVAFIDYEYGLSEKFDAVQINVNIAIASKQIKPKKKPISRLEPDNLVYRQWHRVVVPLQGAGKKKEANVVLWSANQAALAKQALEHALAQSQWMMRRGLLLSAQESNTLHKAKYIMKTAGYGGYLIEQSDRGTLIWAAGLDQWVLITTPIS